MKASSALAFILRLEPLYWLHTRALMRDTILGAEVLFSFSRISGLTFLFCLSVLLNF